MSAVTEAVVREFFELHGFLVRQHRKYVAAHMREDEEIDFFVANPRPLLSPGQVPAYLTAEALPRIDRAIVAVRGGHTEVFNTNVMNDKPDLFRFLDPAILRQAERFFGGPVTFTRILVVPSLPQAEQAHQQSLQFITSRGVNTVLSFRTMLSDLVAATEENRNYQKSDLLQTIRLLKNYDLVRDPQLELFKSGRRAASKSRSAKTVVGPSPEPEVPAP
jgi:hypothetical protein